MVNVLRTSTQIQNNKSTNAVIQDLVEPSKKATNENNVSEYNNLDNDNEYNNFVLLSGAKNRQEIIDKTRELTKDSLEQHDKYERHSDRKYVSKEKQAALIMERFNSLKNKKQVKTFAEYEKLLATSSIEQDVINNKITDERLKTFEEKSAKRRGSGATQELLLQIGTGKKYDPLTDEEKIKVAKATDKFLNNEFGANLKPISTVMHTKESITHMQKLYTSIDDRGRLNAKRAVYDAMQKYNKRHGLQAFKNGDYAGAFKEFVNTVDDFQRNKCVEYGYNKKYDFEFATRGDVSKASKGKTLRQIKVEQLNARAKEQAKIAKEQAKRQQELDEQQQEQDDRAKKLGNVIDELASRDKKVKERERRVSDAEDENIIKNYELRDKERKMQQREQAMQQRETKLDTQEQDLTEAANKFNNKIIDFRTDLLIATFPKANVNRLHTWAKKDVIPFQDGHKEKVIPYVFDKLNTYLDKAIDRAKPIIHAFKKHSDTVDYVQDAVDALTNSVQAHSRSSYSGGRQKHNDDELER